MASSSDPYLLLGVPYTASQAEIRRAFRLAALKYHPDKNLDEHPLSQELFRQCAEAYELLSDPDRRAAYDALRMTAGAAGAGGSGWQTQADADDEEAWQRQSAAEAADGSRSSVADVLGREFADLLFGGDGCVSGSSSVARAEDSAGRTVLRRECFKRQCDGTTVHSVDQVPVAADAEDGKVEGGDEEASVSGRRRVLLTLNLLMVALLFALVFLRDGFGGPRRPQLEL